MYNLRETLDSFFLIEVDEVTVGGDDIYTCSVLLLFFFYFSVHFF